MLLEKDCLITLRDFFVTRITEQTWYRNQTLDDAKNLPGTADEYIENIS